MASILVIEDEPLLARNVCESLALAGHTAKTVNTGEAGLESAEKDPPDIILLDLRLPGIDGLEVMRELQRRGSSASIITMTAYGRIEGAVAAMKSGASDYLQKPLDLKELELVIERVLDHRRVSANLRYLRERERSQSEVEQIIGDSEAMKVVKSLINRIVSTQALAAKIPPSVLLTGETGTGKDMAARAIHYAGPRREGPFVHVNCTALPEHLVEAELFGHVKGAFTDARGDKRGLFEVADGGTIFLDEIGHMPLALQSKLLGVIENRAIRPVGGTSERKINVHVIAASNRNLEAAIKQGEFREDLYHRLRVLNIHLPPLRDRNGDLDRLAQHFIELYAARFGLPVEGYSQEALEQIKSYDWPGNVRELSHTIESAVLITEGSRILPEHLNIKSSHKGVQVQIDITTDKQMTLDFSSPAHCPKLEDVEYHVMKAALEFCGNNLSRAARILGISRDAIRYRMERYRSHKSEIPMEASA